MRKTTFGLKAVGDPRLVLDLTRGREVRRGTRARIEAFMAKTAPPKPARKKRKRARRKTAKK